MIFPLPPGVAHVFGATVVAYGFEQSLLTAALTAAEHGPGVSTLHPHPSQLTTTLSAVPMMGWLFVNGAGHRLLVVETMHRLNGAAAPQ